MIAVPTSGMTSPATEEAFLVALAKDRAANLFEIFCAVRVCFSDMLFNFECSALI